jgi:hypothetical protein
MVHISRMIIAALVRKGEKQKKKNKEKISKFSSVITEPLLSVNKPVNVSALASIDHRH